MGLKVFILAVAVIIVGSCSAALPPQIKVCPKHFPNLAECFKSSMEALTPFLKSGVIAPGFNLEALDPLFIGDVAVNRGFEVNHFGMEAYGVSNFKIEKMRVNLDDFKVEMILYVPKVSTKSKYTLNWKLGLLNLQGGGDCYSYLENVKILLRLTGSRYLRNGLEFIKIDNVHLEVKPKSIKVRYENLFNGQKALEDVANQYINQNINLISEDILPQVERGMEKRILKVANQVFEKASADEFFP